MRFKILERGYLTFSEVNFCGIFGNCITRIR